MRKNFAIVVLAFLAAILGVALFLSAINSHQSCESEGKHKAYHEGSLNAITQCEIGHLEIKIIDDKLEAWFVGGGHDTDRSVRVKTDKIQLSVFLPDGTNKELLLIALPLDLAGEKTGDCSHFEAKADWLKEVKTFQAIGKVYFKDKWQPLIIQYPEGYDRD